MPAVHWLSAVHPPGVGPGPLQVPAGAGAAHCASLGRWLMGMRAEPPDELPLDEPLDDPPEELPLDEPPEELPLDDPLDEPPEELDVLPPSPASDEPIEVSLTPPQATCAATAKTTKIVPRKRAFMTEGHRNPRAAAMQRNFPAACWAE